jgi:hypothetical protein
MMPSLVPLPTFLIIGAQKSGTRWLRSSLGEHPSIYSAPTELEFFNHNFEQGFSWYLERFAGWDGEPVLGEATPGYMFFRERPDVQAARIEGLIPDVRLIAILRNPMDRARSAFIHHLRRGLIPEDADPVEWLENTPPRQDRLGIITGGWYAACLEPYLERFGPSLRIFIYDDVERDPSGVFKAACQHVGAPVDFVPEDIERRTNSGEAVLTETNPDAPILAARDDLRSALYGHYEEDIAKLEEITGLDFNIWRRA